MVTLFVKNNIQKQPSAKYAVKAEMSMKTKSFNDSAKRQAFSAGKRPNSVCLWRHSGHGGSNKRWRPRRFEPSQETGVKKMINGNVSSKFISLWFASMQGAASSIQNCASTFYAYEKYKNGNSARRTATQRHIRPSITQDGSLGISGKLRKVAREKGRDLTQSCDKNPYTHRTIHTATWQFQTSFLENCWSYRGEILHDNLIFHSKGGATFI